MSSTRNEPPARSTRATCRSAGSRAGKWWAAVRQVTVPKVPSRNGRASTSAPRKRTPVAPSAVTNSRAAWTIGSVTSIATTLGVKREKASAVWPPPVAMSRTRAGPALLAPRDELLQVGAARVARALDVGGRARPELGLHPRLLALAHVAARAQDG